MHQFLVCLKNLCFLKSASAGTFCRLSHFCSAAIHARGGVVLALSGGGTRGLAHIGVLEVLMESGIPIAGIVGTSMGARTVVLPQSGLYSRGTPGGDRVPGSYEPHVRKDKPHISPVEPGQQHKPAHKIPWVALRHIGHVVGPPAELPE